MVRDAGIAANYPNNPIGIGVPWGRLTEADDGLNRRPEGETRFAHKGDSSNIAQCADLERTA
jgi:hypothetical protein